MSLPAPPLFKPPTHPPKGLHTSVTIKGLAPVFSTIGTHFQATGFIVSSSPSSVEGTPICMVDVIVSCGQPCAVGVPLAQVCVSLKGFWPSTTTRRSREVAVRSYTWATATPQRQQQQQPHQQQASVGLCLYVAPTGSMMVWAVLRPCRKHHRACFKACHACTPHGLGD